MRDLWQKNRFGKPVHTQHFGRLHPRAGVSIVFGREQYSQVPAGALRELCAPASRVVAKALLRSASKNQLQKRRDR